MRQETEKVHPISKQLVQTWYMKHVFKDLRGSWHCISFSKTKTKTKKSYKSPSDMAKSVSLKRAQTRAAGSSGTSSLRSNADKSGWMFKTFSALYTSNSRRKSSGGGAFAKLKDLMRQNSLESHDPVSCSSITELIASVDFDLRNVSISTDSDLPTTGAAPSRRSSDSFPSTYTSETAESPARFSLAAGLGQPRSAFRGVRHYRRKRSIFRAAKTALGGSNDGKRGGALSSCVDISRTKNGHWRSMSKSLEKKLQREVRELTPEPPRPPPTPQRPENLSRGTSLTMDTSSSTCKSSSAGWMENYDLLTESLSISSWSDKVDCLPETNRGEEWIGRRSVAVEERRYDDQRKPSSPLSIVSTEELKKRQASAVDGARNAGKAFQEAIVDIILENDVHDLVDLEEFLHGYFRLNPLYQDIIQQFFYELSDELGVPHVSNAPSIFARLASANHKSTITKKPAGILQNLLI